MRSWELFKTNAQIIADENDGRHIYTSNVYYLNITDTMAAIVNNHFYEVADTDASDVFTIVRPIL